MSSSNTSTTKGFRTEGHSYSRSCTQFFRQVLTKSTFVISIRRQLLSRQSAILCTVWRSLNTKVFVFDVIIISTNKKRKDSIDSTRLVDNEQIDPIILHETNQFQKYQGGFAIVHHRHRVVRVDDRLRFRPKNIDALEKGIEYPIIRESNESNR